MTTLRAQSVLTPDFTVLMTDVHKVGREIIERRAALRKLYWSWELKK